MVYMRFPSEAVPKVVATMVQHEIASAPKKMKILKLSVGKIVRRIPSLYLLLPFYVLSGSIEKAFLVAERAVPTFGALS